MSAKIAVAVSGGVDSFLAYKILSKKYRCKAFYARFFDDDIPDFSGIRDVQILDLRKEFKKDVIEHFLSELEQGKTPNPCVLCNAKIKFGILFKKALELSKADFLATGHFVRLDNGIITTGDDLIHDQSYFLCQVKKQVLDKCIFPLSKLNKEQVKKEATKLGFKLGKSSADLCFMKSKKTRDFIKENLSLRPGEMITKNGQFLARHEGLALCTLGQKKINHGQEKEFFVISKNPSRNQLVLGDREDLFSKEIKCHSVNFFMDKYKNKAEFKAKVKIRYRESPKKALLKTKDGLINVFFREPVWAPAPGQYAAFYDDKRMIGGGEMMSVRN